MAIESMFGDMKTLMDKFKTTQNNVSYYKELLDEIQEDLNYELKLNKDLVNIVKMLMTERLALYRQHNSIITKLKNGNISIDELESYPSLKKIWKNIMKKQKTIQNN